MPVVKRWEQCTEEDILQANIEKYDSEHIVNFYKDFEEPRYAYIEYNVIFKAVTNMLENTLNRSLRAVDLCGGAGKAAFVLKSCSPDCRVTLVDLSEKMLAIARDRIDRNYIEGIDVVQADAFSFLDSKGEYDLIVLSSALHHFKDPLNLLQSAATRLSKNGIIITIADPTIITKSRRYQFFRFLVASSEHKKTIIRQMVSRNAEINSGADFDMAEYQTYTGIDDRELARGVRNIGLSPLLHLRYPAGEPYMVKIMPYLGLCWAFSLVLGKDENKVPVAVADKLKQEIKREMPFKFHYI
jgi:ubiquinone/menaquinone biosynthesis C-methylase UbiE